MDDEPTAIGIPIGTTLRHIRRHQTFWCLWIGIKDMQAPYHEWIGRYLRLDDNGDMWSVTVREDHSEDMMRIK